MENENGTQGNGAQTRAAAPQSDTKTGIVLSGDTRALSLVPSSFNDVNILAKQLSGSDLIPAVLRGKPGDVAIIIMTGLEYGFSPMMSLRYIYVVEGKPALSADALVSVVMRRTDVCEYFYPTEMTAEKATFTAKRKNAPNATTLTYTYADATAAGLTGKANWKLNRIGMLANRCKSTLAKAVFADLLLGMPSVEEAQDDARVERDVTPLGERPAAGAKVVDAIKSAGDGETRAEPTESARPKKERKSAEAPATVTATTKPIDATEAKTDAKPSDTTKPTEPEKPKIDPSVGLAESSAIIDNADAAATPDEITTLREQLGGAIAAGRIGTTHATRAQKAIDAADGRVNPKK